jgi:tetratricopeptide (TPR) repeat protein
MVRRPCGEREFPDKIGDVRSLIAALVLLLSTAMARAESPAEREARQRYTHAQKLADSGHWADALDEYQRAYELSKYPALLYRIALCQDQLGHTAEALASYKQFLAEEPSSERRASVEQRISVLEAQQQQPNAPAPVVTPAPAPAPVAAGIPPRKTPVYKKWWLWTLVGVAAAGVAVGVGVGVALSSKFQSDLGSFGPSLTVRW